ncbi:MAG TPA: thioredoxin family protein [Kofleriaceae bacterium]|nr:thioredoxin family protein [Kofleriaceae bacterium]
MTAAHRPAGIARRPDGPRALAARAIVVSLALCACHTPTPAAPPTTTPPPPEKTVQLNAPGEPVAIPAVLPAGYVSVVDFWSETCEACVIYGGMLAVGVAKDPRILVRKIDVGDGFTPVARTYQISALPHFLIYDKLKRLRYDLVGSDCEQASQFARQLASE